MIQEEVFYWGNVKNIRRIYEESVIGKLIDNSSVNRYNNAGGDKKCI